MRSNMWKKDKKKADHRKKDDVRAGSVVEKLKREAHDRVAVQEILSLTAGLFMTIGGITTLLMSGWYQSMQVGQAMKDAMMSSWWQIVMPQAYLSIMWAMALASLMAGVTVLFGSYKIHNEPERIKKWGSVVLVASIVGIFCASGFGVGGAILGVIAGASSLRKGARKRYERLD